ncbi:putative neural cadherin-like 2, partial [Homarus americanus]
MPCSEFGSVLYKRFRSGRERRRKQGRKQGEQGTYELGFEVSDVSQGQTGVTANVTVLVTSLTPRHLAHVTPVTLAAHPHQVVTQDQGAQEGESSILNRLVEAARRWIEKAGVDSVDKDSVGVEVVTVEEFGKDTDMPITRVWLTSLGASNLNHVLLYHREEV